VEPVYYARRFYKAMESLTDGDPAGDPNRPILYKQRSDKESTQVNQTAKKIMETFLTTHPASLDNKHTSKTTSTPKTADRREVEADETELSAVSVSVSLQNVPAAKGQNPQFHLSSDAVLDIAPSSIEDSSQGKGNLLENQVTSEHED